jgi:hypothetical protein
VIFGPRAELVAIGAIVLIDEAVRIVVEPRLSRFDFRELYNQWLLRWPGLDVLAVNGCDNAAALQSGSAFAVSQEIRLQSVDQLLLTVGERGY